jgi:hypothetical protein
VLLAISAPLGLLYVPSKLFVSGDAAATANNIRASEGLLRMGIASELIHQIIAVFLVLALYRLFRSVDEGYAKQLVIFGALLSVPIMFVNVLNHVAALVLVSDVEFLTAFDRPQLDALAYLFTRLHGGGITVAAIFWGLWLFPFGILVIRSGFIPRAFGYLLLLAGFGYVVNSFVALVLPQYSPLVSQLTGPLQFAELPIIVWLAVWGAKEDATETVRASLLTTTNG